MQPLACLCILTMCLILLTGEDLLAIAADQPFRFPATFTFVVRAFSGIQHRNLLDQSVCFTVCNKAFRVEIFSLQFWMALGRGLILDLILLRLQNRESAFC